MNKTEKMSIKDKEYDICPVCGEEFDSQCKCPCSEMSCKNGHYWHYCHKHGVRVLGRADHSKDTFGCQCN